MAPRRPLPYSEEFNSPDEYIESLLELLTTNAFLQTLLMRIHILDFLTSPQDLYSRTLPQEWREWLDDFEIFDFLDLLMREDLNQLSDNASAEKWRHGKRPPQSLLLYIRNVRKHLLLRVPSGNQCSRNRAVKPTQKLARQVAVGMNVKKIHEVGLFAHYLDDLAAEISNSTGRKVSHLVDFGSGQNYLGRALASEPYNRRIVAIESRSANAERAKEFDVIAKLRAKKVIIRNKKAYRAALEGGDPNQDMETADTILEPSPTEREGLRDQLGSSDGSIELPATGKGTVQYVDHRINGGDLSHVISDIPESEDDKNLLVMSLHSCGNLVHHGLRSLVANPEVRAVAMVGCCYNLLTSRLGPATYKLPSLRPVPKQMTDKETRTEICDPHGFPMSSRLCNYRSQQSDGNIDDGAEEKKAGVNLDITARMMAVQAPQNWGEKDSEGFFTRHFYRALLQKIFLDRGIVGPPIADNVGGSPLGHSSGGTPIVIGSLRKACYANFVSYVRGALVKLCDSSELGEMFRTKTAGLTDEEIIDYEKRFASRKKDLSVIWSLMAFSAGVVEATIVVDRWLWLKEQEEVGEAWVESVFEYNWSPRNLVVVGIRK
ncbi:Hypothetical protein R9X50_00674300 [Acrodontium crateriforme]|uniref:Methyltransferase domain-containing protein n=1 Tax=Acrodontium crateriforme TaxID=150365 RepID=A0AAQ3MA71_9PEZI|nr:Hypothetical protein R9X50_00674300 [Acrodontium crateriforme]